MQISLLEILVACRLMMLGAIGCGFFGLILSVLGMKCTSIAAQRQKAKSLFALIGGLLLGVAGELLTINYTSCSKNFERRVS